MIAIIGLIAVISQISRDLSSGSARERSGVAIQDGNYRGLTFHVLSVFLHLCLRVYRFLGLHVEMVLRAGVSQYRRSARPGCVATGRVFYVEEFEEEMGD